jgi:hypothetical protein
MLFLYQLLLFTLSVYLISACHNNCHKNGYCNTHNTCVCFDGYEGNDCARRSCPKGLALVDIPNSLDTAHEYTTCSGNGACDYKTGICKCNQGFHGHNCQRSYCHNGCSGKGRCVSLRNAAEEYDGYSLNHTVTYNLWDADLIYGCVCDYGYTGADCSKRSCEYGVDPRLSDLTHESVTLVCTCARGGCYGKFKLRFFGEVVKKWLYPHSTVSELLAALQTAPGIYHNSSAYSFATIESNASRTDLLCVGNEIVKTQIFFRRNAGDLPAISFYANLISSSSGSLYFETLQTVECNCLDHHCNGTFRVSFDGEISRSISSYANGTEIIEVLNRLQTIQSSNFNVTAYIFPTSSYIAQPICARGEIRNFTFAILGNAGNAPKIGLWTSVLLGNHLGFYSTNNTDHVLRLITHDGRDDHVKLCNGIGQCNDQTGVCTCPYGWKFDADYGECGQLEIPTSQFGGLARCPGLIYASDINNPVRKSLDDQSNYIYTRIYLSLNPIHKNSTLKYAVNSTYVEEGYSSIRYYDWDADDADGPRILPSSEVFVLNMTSNTSAGPLVLDAAKDELIYVDANPRNGFIGKASAFGERNNYTRWYTYPSTSYKVFGLALDIRNRIRKLYWSVPGDAGVVDGDIYWAYIDSTKPIIHSLIGYITSTHLYSPYGLAIHYPSHRLYWVDRNTTSKLYGGSVLRSCSLNNFTDYRQEYLLNSKIDNVSIGFNLTDLVIDFHGNNTALLLDNEYPQSIIAINLSPPDVYDNNTVYGDIKNANIFYHTPRVVLPSTSYPMSNIRYMTVDYKRQHLLFTDIDLNRVGYTRYGPTDYTRFHDVFYPYGTAFTDQNEDMQRPHESIGIMIDYGFSAIRLEEDDETSSWNGDIIDCYGRGYCTGLSGGYTCECFPGYTGDCQYASCPKGKAWWQEPYITNIAHDIDVECSNAGVCDHITRSCQCFPGFEGDACQRSSCASLHQETHYPSSACDYAVGQCLTMRELAYYHKNDYLELEYVSYGTKVGDPSTWDADRIQGCKADEYGYFFEDFRSTTDYYNITSHQDILVDNYDCPMGYNMRLTYTSYYNSSSYYGTNTTANHTNHREIQQLQCDAYQGYFRLSFRGKSSGILYANSSESTLLHTLESIPSIGAISIAMTASTVCLSSQTTYTNITFLSEVGNIPLLQIEEDLLGGRTGRLYVNRIQRGISGDLFECSGHGNCNRKTGECQCWEGYGPSDGLGNAGKRADCGYSWV